MDGASSAKRVLDKARTCSPGMIRAEHRHSRGNSSFILDISGRGEGLVMVCLSVLFCEIRETRCRL